jgi:hypothetical protein
VKEAAAAEELVSEWWAGGVVHTGVESKEGRKLGS